MITYAASTLFALRYLKINAQLWQERDAWARKTNMFALVPPMLVINLSRAMEKIAAANDSLFADCQ